MSLMRFSVVMGALFAAMPTLPALAVPSIVGGGSEGVTTDIIDAAQGAKIDVAGSTASPIFAYDRAIGVTGVGGETTHTIFSDAGGPGTVQQFTLRTPRPVNVANFNLYLAQDGASSNRSATVARVYASNDNINFFEISDTSDVTPSLSNYQTNYGNPLITVSDTPNATAQFFRVETTRTNNGPRIWEFDAFGSNVAFTVNPNILNAASNTGVDEPAGLSNNFTVSSRVQGTDDPEGAFGNNDGPVEPATFIFGDTGVADNGNGVLGDGGETVDFIQWQTTSPIILGGYEINLGGDGEGSAIRGAELIRFLVEGVQVDLFDNNHMSGTVARLFAGGNVTGNDFRIEFTRSTTNSGPRIGEINAIAAIVPEPASMSLLALGGIALLRRRREA